MKIAPFELIFLHFFEGFCKTTGLKGQFFIKIKMILRNTSFTYSE